MRLENEAQKAQYKNIWVLAEIIRGKIAPVTFELLGAARALADVRGCEAVAVALGSGIENESALFAHGADQIILVDDEALALFNDERACAVLNRLIEKYKPEVLLGAATAQGRALVPRLAVETICGLTADCTGLSIDPATGDLLQTRPAFGGNLMATIRTPHHRPQMATVRPHVMRPLPHDPARTGLILRETLLPEDSANAKEVLETTVDNDIGVNLGDAEIIVAGGRGVRGAKGFELLRQLARALGGAVAASRACVDSGWISYPHQVGQTGQTVQAKLYIACGISGQIQHLVGMQSCETIVAIDINPNTPMMQMADIALTGDLFEVVPALIEEISNGNRQ